MFSGWNKTCLTREILHHVLQNSEVISRLFQEKYVSPFISEKLVKQSKSDHTILKKSKEFEEYYTEYVEMQKRCSAGEVRVTPKYWMLYVRIIDSIQQLHFVININDYHLRLRNLGGINGAKFYNKHSELSTIWYILSNTDGVT